MHETGGHCGEIWLLALQETASSLTFKPLALQLARLREQQNRATAGEDALMDIAAGSCKVRT